MGVHTFYRPGAVWRNRVGSVPIGAFPEMIVLPAGRFFMGSPNTDPDAFDVEFPQHEVTLEAPFAIGRFPITVDNWTTAETAGAKLHSPSPTLLERSSWPVTEVNWFDAQNYIAWLNEVLGLSGRVDAYRLPSEAEWEYACRAGASTRYAWGDEPSMKLANMSGYDRYGRNIIRREVMSVNAHPANAFGVFDMHGNVWEWCADSWHENFVGAPCDGSTWDEGDYSEHRVMRGGAHFFLGRDIRAAVRYGEVAAERAAQFGFRVARSLPSYEDAPSDGYLSA